MIDPSARLDLVEDLYLRMPDPSGVRIHAYLAERKPKKGCNCGKGARCRHGRPRLESPEGGPYSLRTVQVWLKEVKRRLRARLEVRREENRALAVARLDATFDLAIQQGETRDAIAATARRAELDGSHLAAEEAQRPRLYDRVRELMLAVEDYTPPAAPAEPPVPVPREVARHQLARLERLLLLADEGAARYRALGEPKDKSEAERLAWRRDVLDEAIRQTVTSPAVPAEKKRDLIVKAAGTASMITEAADLVDEVKALRKTVDRMGGKGAT